MNRPAAPPEAVLIRLAREAANIRVSEAAKLAGVSTARWSQVESGHETRNGEYRQVRAKAGTVAHMAHAVGITAGRLETEGVRPDAAVILKEIERQEAEQAAAPAPPAGTHTLAGVAGAGAIAPPPAVLTGEAVQDEREELRDRLAQAELEAKVTELENQIWAEIRAALRDGRDPFPGDDLSAQVWASGRSEEYRIAALALIRMAAQRQKKNQIRQAG